MKTTCNTNLSGAKALAFKRLLLVGLATAAACADDDDAAAVNPAPPTSSYRADVAVVWLNMQLRLVRTTPTVAANVLARPALLRERPGSGQKSSPEHQRQA